MKSVIVDNTKPCERCGFYANRGTSINAVIIQGDEILLILRKNNPFKGSWALPGGYIDWNFSAPDTVIKEVKEETNLDVVSMKLIGVQSDPARHPQQTIALTYLVVAQGDLLAGDDAVQAKYFPLNNLPGNLAADHHESIKSALEQE